MKTRKANGTYRTWWNTKRVNEKVKYSDLVELLGMKKTQRGQLSQYFSGKIMPKEDMIRKIADAFGVSYDEAYSHFFNDWCGSKSKNQVKTFSAPDDIKEVDEVMDDYKTGMLDRESILKKVYGIVDFDTYLIIDEALLVGSSKDVLKNIYGKISFDAYQEVLKCL